MVTSMYLQLHPYLPFEAVFLVPTFFGCVADQLNEEQRAILVDTMFSSFLVKFLLDPASINVTADASNACGKPDVTPYLYCYGDGSGTGAYVEVQA